MTENEIKVCKGLLKLFKIDGKTADEIITDGQLSIFHELIFRKHNRVQILTSTQYGKSFVVALACIIISCIQKELVAVVAPTNEKAKIIMRYYIEHLADNPLFYSQLEKDTRLERLRMEESKERIILKNGGGIYIISVQAGNSKKGIESAMGAGCKNVIEDEAGLIPDPIEATVFRMIAGKGQDAFYCKIGNPFYRNHFLRSWRDEKYHKIFIDYKQGLLEGRYNQEFIDEARSKPYFDVLFECLFPKADAIDSGGFSSLIGEDYLMNHIKTTVPLFGELRMGCDVAGEGSNYSAITLRGKNGAKMIYKEHNPDTMNFVNVILEKFKEHKPNKVYIDKVGIGKPVYDRLKEFPEISDKIVGVMAGETAEDNINYFNKRAEMFWRLKEWLAVSELEGNDWADMLDVKYKIQSDRKVKIKSKDEMMKDGIMSPDCFVAGTKILTNKGERNIETLVIGDFVITPFGKRKVIKVWKVETEELIKASFSNGKCLVGKPKHKIMTKRGFISLDSLLLTDVIDTRNIYSYLLWKIKKLLFITDANIGLRKQADIFMPIFMTGVENQQEKKKPYIVKYGETIIQIKKFLKDFAFIIKTETQKIMNVKIWNLLKVKRTIKIICESNLLIKNLKKQIKNNLISSDRLLLCGINLKRGENGIENTQEKYGVIQKQPMESVLNAGNQLLNTIQIKNSVVEVALKKQNGEVKRIIQIKDFVWFVKKSLWRIGIGIQNVVIESVEVLCVGKTKVYNLTLEQDNVYYANGILVENCADSLSLTFYDREARPALFSLMTDDDIKEKNEAI